MQTLNHFSHSAFAAPDRIVVATDLTDIDYLVPHAIAQAKASRSALTLVHIIEPGVGAPTEAGSLPYMSPAKTHGQARLALESVTCKVREQGVECSAVVRHGFAIDKIAEIIRETGAGRLIAGTHSRRGIKKMVLGSVAQRLLTNSNIPVCIIGPHAHAPAAQGPPRTILHPVSLSGAYEQSAMLALKLARYCKAQLVLLHVFDPDLESEIGPGRTVTLPYSPLESLVPHDDLLPAVLTRETVGQVILEILRVADEIHADFIVLGVHADSLLWAPQAGSTAYEIIASATCPVLTLKVEPAQIPEAVEAQAHSTSFESSVRRRNDVSTHGQPPHH